MSKNCFLILSCDKYFELAEESVEIFLNNVDIGDYKLYFSSNSKIINKNKVNNISTELFDTWSSELKITLEKIPEDNIFIILEDFFITSKISKNKIQEIFKLFNEDNMTHLKFWNIPKADILKNNYYSEYVKGAPYRVTVNGIWKKKVLLDLLYQHESAWEFEINGSYRSQKFNNFFGLNERLFEFINIVEKGKIFRKHKDYEFKNKDEILNKFKIQTIPEYILSLSKMTIANIMFSISWKIRLKIIGFLKKLLQIY